MRRRNYGVLFAILLLALINLSPGKNTMLTTNNVNEGIQRPSVPKKEMSSVTGTIRVAVQLSDTEFEGLQQMNQQFSANYRVQVELIRIPSEENYSHTQLKLLSLGESPDVLSLDSLWVRYFAAQGYLLPVDTYYPGSLSGQMLSASFVQNEWNDLVWGVPLDMDPYVWVYNPEILRKLGLATIPSGNVEWTKLSENMKRQSQVKHLLALNYDDPQALFSWMWSMGDQPGSTQGENESLEVTETTEQTVRSLEMIRPYLYPAKGTLLGENGNLWGMLNRGEIAMALLKVSDLQPSATLPSSLSVSLLDDEMSPKSNVWVKGRSYVVSSQTSSPEAAGQWIKVMTSKSEQRKWYETSGHLPVLKSLYAEPVNSKMPEWVPVSTWLNVKAEVQPLSGLDLPQRIEKLHRPTGDFLRGNVSGKQFIQQMQQIKETGS